jgi:16S rRNA (guanine966-N2)-methyltransferase
MRITGGNIRGRKIRVPRVAVRPTQDRVREALFSALQTRIPGARFLDLFAGSGAVGLEAWSRGAEEVCWVEEDRRVFEVLKRNTSDLWDSSDGGGKPQCFCCDAVRFLRRGLASTGFDVIFADPPYQKGRRRDAESLPLRVMRAVAETDMLAPHGLLVLEQGADEEASELAEWELIRDKRYGGTRLFFFKRKGDGA